MAVELFKLVGSIFIDNEKANESLQKTDKKAESFGQTLGKTAKSALKFATVGVGAMMAVGGAAITTANDVAQTADEIDKASIRMNISAESYQELAYAAGQCGVEMSTMEKAAKKLEGTNLNFDDAINQIMSLTTAEERSKKASKLFGESIAYQLSPLIEQSSDEFDGLIQRANDLGLVLSEDAVKAGVEFGDLMSDVKQTVSSLKNAVGTALFPILITFLQQILVYMPEIQGFIVQLTPSIKQIVSAVLPVLFALLEALLPVAVQLIEAVLPLAIELINALLPLITALLPLIDPIASLLLAIIVPLVQILTELLPPIIAILTSWITNQAPALANMIGFLEECVTNTLAVLKDAIIPWVESIISIFAGLEQFISGVFTGNWEMAWEGIKNITKGFVNTIITYIQGTINAVIALINLVVDSALTLANLVPGVDINTDIAKIPNVNIPLLAKGGVVTGEGQAIVGEEGAELLTLPKGASVQPLDNTSTITKEDLVDAFVEAFSRVGINITVNGNENNLFDVVVKKNTVYKRTHGGVSAI